MSGNGKLTWLAQGLLCAPVDSPSAFGFGIPIPPSGLPAKSLLSIMSTHACPC